MKTNQEIMALELFKAMNNKDFSGIMEYLSDEVVFDFPGSGRIEGKRRVVLFLNALLRKYPILCFNVSEIIVDGDQVCAIWTNKGENLVKEPYENSGVTIFHMEDEKIIFFSDYFKDTSFVK
jgi:ketosteroid isomerase-like protein